VIQKVKFKINKKKTRMNNKKKSYGFLGIDAYGWRRPVLLRVDSRDKNFVEKCHIITFEQIPAIYFADRWELFTFQRSVGTTAVRICIGPRHFHLTIRKYHLLVRWNFSLFLPRPAHCCYRWSLARRS